MRELAKLFLLTFTAVVWAGAAWAQSIDLTVIDPPLEHTPAHAISFVLRLSLRPGSVRPNPGLLLVRRQTKWDNFLSELMDTFLMDDGLINSSSLRGSPRL